MNLAPTGIVTSRIGFHYYPDTVHYTNSDLTTWLPRLKELGAAWITLRASSDRAIPEPFLRGLLQANIQPIVHFNFSARSLPDLSSLNLLFSIYASWGVRYIVLFDRPNLRKNWPAASWVQSDLVERFLDVYLPLAEAALQAGLKNVFPPLEPGGDYWDTAFLRAALQGLQRRGKHELLSTLTLGAYAWCDDQPLHWGAGGPERWPATRPYITPAGQEDQRGLYIFDWYQAIAQAVLKTRKPILLLGAGSRLKPGPDGFISEIDEINHAHRNLAIARRLEQPASDGDLTASVDHLLPPVPEDVLAVCFWLLAAATDDADAAQAWYQPDGSPMSAADVLRRWVTTQQEPDLPLEEPGALPPEEVETEAPAPALSEESPSSNPQPNPPQAEIHPPETGAHSIAHYLLLPIYEWGAAEWHLDAARPFILRHHPTVGFSIDEAAHAAQVTVVGSDQTFSDQLLADFRSAGCVVRRISGDGIEIASQLANL